MQPADPAATWTCAKCSYTNAGPVCTHCGNVPNDPAALVAELERIDKAMSAAPWTFILADAELVNPGGVVCANTGRGHDSLSDDDGLGIASLRNAVPSIITALTQAATDRAEAERAERVLANMTIAERFTVEHPREMLREAGDNLALADKLEEVVHRKHKVLRVAEAERDAALARADALAGAAERLLVYLTLHKQAHPEWNGNRADDERLARAALAAYRAGRDAGTGEGAK